MKQFLLGNGWMTVWYLVCYFFALFCVGMPLYMTWDYVKEGKEPGPGALGLFGVLILIPFFIGGISFVNSLLFLPIVQGQWWHKAALVLGLPTMLAGALLPPIFTLCNRPSWIALIILAALTIFAAFANLWLLYRAANMERGSVVLANTNWLPGVLLLASVPTVLIVLLIIIGRFSRS